MPVGGRKFDSHLFVIFHYTHSHPWLRDIFEQRSRDTTCKVVALKSKDGQAATQRICCSRMCTVYKSIDKQVSILKPCKVKPFRASRRKDDATRGNAVRSSLLPAIDLLCPYFSFCQKAQAATTHSGTRRRICIQTPNDFGSNLSILLKFAKTKVAHDGGGGDLVWAW